MKLMEVYGGKIMGSMTDSQSAAHESLRADGTSRKFTAALLSASAVDVNKLMELAA